MTKFIIAYDNGEADATEIQRWMKENRIKHGPTIKTSNGWEFDIFDKDNHADAMAFKLRWM